jgi:hypothetical protein
MCVYLSKIVRFGQLVGSAKEVADPEKMAHSEQNTTDSRKRPWSRALEDSEGQEEKAGQSANPKSLRVSEGHGQAAGAGGRVLGVMQSKEDKVIASLLDEIERLKGLGVPATAGSLWGQPLRDALADSPKGKGLRSEADPPTLATDMSLSGFTESTFTPRAQAAIQAAIAEELQVKADVVLITNIQYAVGGGATFHVVITSSKHQAGSIEKQLAALADVSITGTKDRLNARIRDELTQAEIFDVVVEVVTCTEPALSFPKYGMLKCVQDMTPMLHGATRFTTRDGLTRSLFEEFRDNDEGKWLTAYNYVVHECASEHPQEERASKRNSGEVLSRDPGHHGKDFRLQDFAQLKEAVAARLTLAELAAIRLYTAVTGEGATPINQALRNAHVVQMRLDDDPLASDPDDGRVLREAQNWATTVALLTSAIFKLSTVSVAENVGDVEMFRAVPGLLVPGDAKLLGFSSGSFCGIVEAAPLSFSPSTAVNLQYCGGADQLALIYVLKSSWSARGAKLSTFSQYPQEDEWTLPPFTGLELLDQPEWIGNKQLVHVRPHVSHMRHYTDALKYPDSSPNDPLTPEEHAAFLVAVTNRRAELVVKFKAAEVATAAAGKTEVTEREEPAPTNSNKLAVQANDLLTGAPKTAALGLEGFMRITPQEAAELRGGGVDAIRGEFEEHGSEKDKKWLKYIADEEATPGTGEWGKYDEGREGNPRLADFAEMKEAKDAELSVANTLALRLYTSPAYGSLNDPLRDFDEVCQCDAKLWCKSSSPFSVLKNGALECPVCGTKKHEARHCMKSKHPFPATILHVRDAILKLRAVDAAKEAEGAARNGAAVSGGSADSAHGGAGSGSQGAAAQTLWRGIKNVNMPESFMSGGGVELGVMSATYDLSTAVQFSCATLEELERGALVIFKFVTSSFMERGASVEWLSVFPKERECVFPPLTFMSPTGRRQNMRSMPGQQTGNYTIIEVAPRL